MWDRKLKAMKRKRNIKLLKKVRAMILKRPDQFVMCAWFNDLNAVGGIPGHCGTAACIGGWAITLSERRFKSMPKKARAFVISNDCAENPLPVARKVLNISEDESLRLFNMNNWPIEYRRAYYNANSAKAVAKVAAARINHFIKYRL